MKKTNLFRTLSLVLALVLTLLAVSESSVMVNAAEIANNTATVSGDSVSDNTVSSNVVLKGMKINVKPLFDQAKIATVKKFVIDKKASDKKVATVTKKGVLTAKKAGKVVINAVAKDKTVLDTITVEVRDVAKATKANKKLAAYGVGDVVDLNKVIPAIDGDYKVTFKVTDKKGVLGTSTTVYTVSENTVSGNKVYTVSDNTVSVSGNGMFVATKAGKVKVTATVTLVDDKNVVKTLKYKAVVTVKMPSFNKKSVTLKKVGKSAVIKAKKGTTVQKWLVAQDTAVIKGDVDTKNRVKVTALASGTAELVAVVDGKCYFIPVKVK